MYLYNDRKSTGWLGLIKKDNYVLAEKIGEREFENADGWPFCFYLMKLPDGRIKDVKEDSLYEVDSDLSKKQINKLLDSMNKGII